MDLTMSIRNLTCSFLLGVAGCSTTVDSGPTCGPDSTVVCAGGSGYSCTGGDRPEDSNANITCSDPETGNAGSTLYCCISAFASGSSCGPDDTVTGCEPPSIGYSCTGTDTPDEENSDLNCSINGVPGNAGSLLYCCE
jgi:hypothetical protein